MKDLSKCSGFVIAGFETLAGLLDKFLVNKDFPDHFTKDQIQEFFVRTSNRFLHSYGHNVSQKSYRTTHAKLVAKNLRKCRDIGLFDKGLFYVDSGGFQISVGKLDRDQTQALSESYYGFIENYSDVYDRVFTLDVVPGPGCKVLKSFKDVYDYNMKSYDTAKNLPLEIRKKVIYIHHFRTPTLWKIFNEILNIDGMFESFEHFSTGGIVANMASDIIIPCIIYVLPLVPLLIKAKESGKKDIDFHVLGGSNYRDILFYELIKKHVLEEHGIKLTITYDSSGLWKGLLQGRYLIILDERISKKLDLREKWLDLSWSGIDSTFTNSNLTRKERFLEEVNLMASAFNFKKLSLENRTLYNPKTGTFYRDINVYAMLYLLWMFSRVEEMCRNIIDEAYDFYLAKDFKRFNEIINESTRCFNQGKKTKKQKVKSHNSLKSLEVLSKLDIEYCEYVLHKALSRDEFSYLTKLDKILSW